MTSPPVAGSRIVAILRTLTFQIVFYTATAIGAVIVRRRRAG